MQMLDAIVRVCVFLGRSLRICIFNKRAGTSNLLAKELDTGRGEEWGYFCSLLWRS